MPDRSIGRLASSSDYPQISHHAVIGDTRTAALIAGDGTVDWLCLPRFDSASVFGALLDTRRGGRWSLRPTAPFSVARRYLGETNVLETRFSTDAGVVRVTDAMTITVRDDGGARLAPEHELLRSVTGESGSVELEMIFEPRPGYGQSTPTLRDRGALGISLAADGQALTLLSEAGCALSTDSTRATARLTVGAGERRRLALVSDRTGPAVLPPLAAAADARLAATQRWWERWSAATDYDGPYRDAVARSALALKLLVYSPSGAIVAAPTSSLPEVIGGSKNWDYRYCWLRDAAFTFTALFDVGHEEEADSFLAWLLHATRVTLPRLNPIYDVHGRADLPERELALDGYRGSRPVRVGNAAASQHQLDVYGEVIDAAMRHAQRGGRLDGAHKRMLAKLGEHVCRVWEAPDSGIWESRGHDRQYTHSKMLACIALDRLLELAEHGGWQLDRERVRRNRDEIRARVERDGWDAEQETYVRALRQRELDAAVLSGFLHGYADWDSPRVSGTLDAVCARLADGALVRRDSDGEIGGGAFGAASFWLVECLARAGRPDEARRRFEELLGYANDVGLYGEEIDAPSGASLGNFPLALTHVALINAARAVQQEANRR